MKHQGLWGEDTRHSHSKDVLHGTLSTSHLLSWRFCLKLFKMQSWIFNNFHINSSAPKACQQRNRLIFGTQSTVLVPWRGKKVQDITYKKIIITGNRVSGKKWRTGKQMYKISRGERSYCVRVDLETSWKWRPLRYRLRVHACVLTHWQLYRGALEIGWKKFKI